MPATMEVLIHMTNLNHKRSTPVDCRAGLYVVERISWCQNVYSNGRRQSFSARTLRTRDQINGFGIMAMLHSGELAPLDEGHRSRVTLISSDFEC